MSNLIEIQNQIEKLTRQANEIKDREFDKTVQEILAKMNAFGIGLKDLQSRKTLKASATKAGKPRLPASKPTSGRVKSKHAGSVIAPKFLGPNGETWSGRGLMPRWLSALVAQGKTKEDFAIKS